MAIEGAAGYIGGSIVADFAKGGSDSLIKSQNVIAAVRSPEQAEAFSKLGVDVLQLELLDEPAVVKAVLDHNIDIVIHLASSINTEMALNLITALGKKREQSGKETYLIHTSGEGAFIDASGWTFGKTEDSGPLFDYETQLQESFPIRKTDVSVIEHAKAQGVTSFVVIPPMVYGKGSGPWNQLSVILPISVKASIADKVVHKFAGNNKISGVHVSDLAQFYRLLVEKALRKESLPHGEQGYYSGAAHEIDWQELQDRLAAALHARGMASTSEVQTWASDEAAAKSLGVPTEYVRVLWDHSTNIIPKNREKLGWVPAWDKERFLKNLDEEIDAVVELGSAKSSLVAALHASVQK
ncbi:hypothetical protein BX600DRAFT_467051 [Xylariales sp. PMI_506]|nr:hypothetical protein BX600DRAFT_467051 [Xylariales sp. PMI_506]